MIGTLVNAAAIIAGSLAGMMIRSRLPQKTVEIVFQGIGLFTMALGISMSLKTDNMLLSVLSLVIGGVIGQALHLDTRLRQLSERLQRLDWRKAGTVNAVKNAHSVQSAKSVGETKSVSEESDSPEKIPVEAETPGGTSRFTEGLVTATMLFCVGSMSILGAIEEGSGEAPRLLLTKSIMDGISSIALASSFGICILFSSVPLLIYQGGLTLFAGFMMHFLSASMMADLTGVGGILLIGLGINILKIKEINVINMLPALIVAVALSYFW